MKRKKASDFFAFQTSDEVQEPMPEIITTGSSSFTNHPADSDSELLVTINKQYVNDSATTTSKIVQDLKNVSTSPMKSSKSTKRQLMKALISKEFDSIGPAPTINMKAAEVTRKSYDSSVIDDYKLKVINAVKDEECSTIASHPSLWTNSKFSDSSASDDRHCNAIFSTFNNSSNDSTPSATVIKKPLIIHSSPNSISTSLPLYKTLKTGDRVLYSAPESENTSWSSIVPRCATIKAVMHSGYTSAKYDIVLDEQSHSKHSRANHFSVLTVGWSALRRIDPSVTTFHPPPPCPPQCHKLSLYPSPLPQPPSKIKLPNIDASMAPAVTQQNPSIKPSSSSLQPQQQSHPDSSLTVNSALFNNRTKGGWRSAVTSPNPNFIAK